LKDAARPLRSRARVRFHVGTSEIMARAILLDRTELAPGEESFARFRLEGQLVARPGDRFVVRSYSPVVTIGGGTLLDVDPPRFRRKGTAAIDHLSLLQTGSPEVVLEEHIRHVGAGGVRLTTLAGRVPFGPARLRELLEKLQAAGRAVAIDRDWFIHPDSFTRLRGLVVDELTAFHRASPLKPGMSREELRGRAGAADERVFGFLLSSLDAEGIVKIDRDKVRLASHAVRLSPEQQRIVDVLESEFSRA